MNHDIAHCTGNKGDHVCAGCFWRKAHEELLQKVNRGETASGERHTYLNAEDCVRNGHDMAMITGDKNWRE